MSQRRELVASDEIDALKRHQREVMDLETDLKKREREERELGEEVRMLERENESVSVLKLTLSSQAATAHLTLTTQNNVLQAQFNALQSSLNTCTSSISSLRLELETAQARTKELELGRDRSGGSEEEVA